MKTPLKTTITVSARAEAHKGDDAFVDWFRQCTPYVHAHRDRSFVIAFGGEALDDARLPELIHDIALLHGLGIRLALVHGARPQIERRLAERGAELRYVNGLRITNDLALRCVKEAAGSARVEIEALLSMGLANSPMAGVRIPVASGNFVTARPLGVLDGVDYEHTGAVRRIDRKALRQRLDDGAVALLPPIGYSPTGEVFNLSATDVARASATALSADKLIFLAERQTLAPLAAHMGASLLVTEADRLLRETPGLGEDLEQLLRAAISACRGGIRRVHLIDRQDPGALLRELFTRDGVGLLISGEPFEELRHARLEDLPGIAELLQPLERQGVLIARPLAQLEPDIERFLVTERDGAIISCAALYPYPEQGLAELAGVAVHPDYRSEGRGDRLLARIETLARDQGLSGLFVLTTQTAHWFRERGFEPAKIAILPETRRELYNRQRNSQVYLKRL